MLLWLDRQKEQAARQNAMRAWLGRLADQLRGGLLRPGAPGRVATARPCGRGSRGWVAAQGCLLSCLVRPAQALLGNVWIPGQIVMAGEVMADEEMMFGSVKW